MSPIKAITTAVASFLLIAFAFGSYFTVQPGERAFLKTFGSIGDTVYDAGFHYKRPFIDSPVKMDVQTQNLQVDANAASKDLQSVQTKIAVNFNLRPDHIREIYAQVGDEETITNRLIYPAIQETIKAATSQFTADQLITKRADIRDLALKTLSEKLADKGVQVTDVNIVNFAFSPSFDASIEAKVKAEQDALTAKNQLERIKYEAEQAVATAQGQKDATIAKAQGEAEAIRIQSEAIQQNGGPQYIELKRIEKWNGTLPTMITNGTPLLNIK